MATMSVDTLVRDHLALTPSVIKKHFSCNLSEDSDFETLRSDGDVGLLVAATRYEEQRGASFSSFAYKYIKGYINKGIQKRNRNNLFFTNLDDCYAVEDTRSHDTYDIPPQIDMKMRTVLDAFSYWIIVDRFFNGLTYEEIAVEFSSNKQTIHRVANKAIGILSADKEFIEELQDIVDEQMVIPRLLPKWK